VLNVYGVDIPKVDISLSAPSEPADLVSSLQVLLVLTLLVLAPGLILVMTSFLRLIIVFSFLRQALGTQQMPPSQVLTSLAMILTFFIMEPIGQKAYEQGVKPYMDKEISYVVAFERGTEPFKEFMIKNTREKDLALFLRIRGMQNPKTFLRQTQYLNRKHYQTANDSLAHLLSTQKQIHAAVDLLEKKLHNSSRGAVNFPSGDFGRDLQQVSNLIVNGVHLPVFKVTLAGFDTHAGQKGTHNNLMYQLGGGLRAFYNSMQKAGLWDNVLVMTYSEFGRRVAENTSQGTDHGSASAHFVLGGKVKKGIYGKEPSLIDLDDGDLKPTVDFRQMYATVAQRWWRRPNPWHGHRPLPFV